MKPGMQRDILVAYWLLFDEMGLGDDDPPAQSDRSRPVTPAAPTAAAEPEKPKRNNGGKARRRP